MSRILVGTCSWADATLVKDSNFYPPWAKSSLSRLQYYESQFDIVEVDSSYYSMPAEQTSLHWAKSTSSKFIFDVKSFRIFTRHPTPLNVLPKDIARALPARLVEEKKNVYYKDLPDELTGELWQRFSHALLPLHHADKLGVILFQFPPWFYAGNQQLDYILECKQRLPHFNLAIEFRNNTWLNEKNHATTIEFLRDNQLSFVCVDEPQGLTSSVPPVAEATAPISVVRFHGRNSKTWESKEITTTERFNYLYSQEELLEWVPKIHQLESKSEQVHVLFNNHWRDRAVTNGRQMKLLLS